MKYCPNPVCPHRLRTRKSAEFLDRATVCNDCGIPLVDKSALASPETAAAVSSWHADRERVAPASESATLSGRVDIVTGGALIGLSLALLGASLMMTTSRGGTGYVVAIGPFVYGVIRLSRGLDARKATRR